LGKTDTIKDRAVSVYLPSTKQKQRWQEAADKGGISLSKWIAERGEITTSELLRKVRSEGIFDEDELVTILLSLARWHIIEFQRKHTGHLTLSSSRRSFN
jgi:hypothetical protein